jgi:hypothetical protein
MLSVAPAMASSPPTIEGISVSGLTASDATLEAQVNPGGLETTYEFHMTSFACQHDGEPTGCQVINDWFFPSGRIAAASGDQAVKLDLNSAGVTLQPDTWYEYSVAASNAAGEAPEGGHWETIEREFKTLATEPPCSDGCPGNSREPYSSPISVEAISSANEWGAGAPEREAARQRAASEQAQREAAGPPSVAPVIAAAAAHAATTTITPKPLTSARTLAAALKSCKKEKSKKRRAACAKQARRRYGPATQKAGK